MSVSECSMCIDDEKWQILLLFVFFTIVQIYSNYITDNILVVIQLSIW